MQSRRASVARCGMAARATHRSRQILENHCVNRDIEFNADDDIILRGFVVTPDAPGPHPVVVMTHGAGGYKEWFLPGLAEILASAGIASLAYDHRNFADRDGEPRCEIDAGRQIDDYRTAVTFAEMQPDLDPIRIGIFGTSFSGGNALV